MDEIQELNVDFEELFEHHRFVADKRQSILRIDKFLFDRIQNASRTKIQEAAEAGNILVNGLSVKSNYKVKPGDIVSVVMEYPPREITIIPEDIPLDILYEDEQVLVINKKPGMVVHPSYGHYTGTLVNAIAFHIKDFAVFKGDPRPGLVHRIDKDTSGILVIAKTEHAKSHLGLQFYHHTIQRKYNALVWGTFNENQGTVTGHIGRSLQDRKKMFVFPDGEHGKEAITHYRVIEKLGYVSLVECQLETGRTHQIRVHMKYIGHPVFNDETYGGDQILKGTTFTKYKQYIQNCFKMIPRQALHAKSLGFVHPVTEKDMYFETELPEDLKNVVEKWRHYIENRDLE